MGVSDAPTGRSDLRRLNPLTELSPAMTLSGMRRLIDSDRSPASSLLVSHPCSYRRGRLVGAFSSVRRAGRLRIANGHARTHRRDVVSRPVWTAQQGLPSGASRGHSWVPGTSQGPMGFLGKATFRSGLRPLGKSANPTPEPTTSDPQGVAVLPGGALLPPRLDRTTGPSPWSAWQQTGTHGFLATRRNPLGSWRRRRDDPQALACGEPAAASVSIPLNRRRNEAL